ncbi:beta-galactosidase [Demequina sp. SYSU T00192]|uniref:beta-galactosidase n=1 Tax=Demequina litoralis TaxID=3051660 RepID=A0ABT8GB27_9MICO|nr:beta-galactosidase [Demequina sp. SYSU T00192]MDN4476338.1 beta-galactosidase [Demequina sp. SYSU T00192]
MEHSSTAAAPGRIDLGVAYYPEYQRHDRLETDLDLMVEAGITTIRVGESVWSTWEPREGRYDLEWLAPTLDAAHERGIRVILGTPTYAVPPWLQVAHPEIAADRATGEPIPWGARQEMDFTHPEFLARAERLIRAILDRYASHPSVVGFQVDNEPGIEIFHNDQVFARFVATLAATYGDVDTLNREWGLTYWSHRLQDWSELWRPDGNSFPQYDLAWRTFQADLTAEFIAWQAGLVEEYRDPAQFVTTCFQYPRAALDDQRTAEALTVTAGNPYYGMQDRLAIEDRRPTTEYWTTSGVPTLFRQGDRMFSSKQARYLVTETNAQAIGDSASNYPPYPGQLAQAAFALISRGAALVEYWQWNTLPYGAETYWGGVLPHSLEPGRVYDEIAGIGTRLKGLGGLLDGYEPDADVAVLWSIPSKHALQFQPPFRMPAGDEGDPYERIVDAFYDGAFDSRAQVRILHLGQAHALGAEELVRRYPVLVAAGLYIASDDDIALLDDYAKAGGHLVLGPRTAYADTEARARHQVAPPGLADAASARYEEFSNLDAPVPATGTPALALPDGAAAELWIDGLIPEAAEVLAGYDHPRFRDFAAVTSAPSGAGRVTTVGCVPTRELAAAVVSHAVGGTSPDGLLADPPAAVTASSGTLPDGRRVWFVFNWGWTPATVALARPVTDPIGDAAHAAGDHLELSAWATAVLVGEQIHPESPNLGK